MQYRLQYRSNSQVTIWTNAQRVYDSQHLAQLAANQENAAYGWQKFRVTPA